MSGSKNFLYCWADFFTKSRNHEKKIDGHYALLSDLTWMLRAIYVKINEEKFSLTKNELSSDFNSSKKKNVTAK